jgi:hypothetical protein
MKTTTFLLFFVCCTLIGYSQTGNQSGSANFDEAKEKAAILAVITAETENFYKRDYEGWKKCYIHADYAFQSWNNGDGTFDAKVGWPEVDKNIGNYIRSNPVAPGSASHPKVERHNMVWKFYNPELAFMIWDQYNSDKEMKMFHHSKETRLMEKQNGSWKVVSVASYWDYKNLVSADSLKLMSEK